MKLNEVATEYPNLWIVFYTYDSRGSGIYIVNAPTKKAATDIIRAMNLGYRSIQAVTVEQGAEEYGMYEAEFLDGVQIPRPGEATHLEAGT